MYVFMPRELKCGSGLLDLQVRKIDIRGCNLLDCALSMLWYGIATVPGYRYLSKESKPLPSSPVGPNFSFNS